MSHTPTPWAIDETNKDLIVDEQDCVIAVCSTPEIDPIEWNGGNAELIVLAVNSHQAMKEALELYLESSLYINGEMEEKVPSLKRARTLGYKAIQQAKGGSTP